MGLNSQKLWVVNYLKKLRKDIVKDTDVHYTTVSRTI